MNKLTQFTTLYEKTTFIAFRIVSSNIFSRNLRSDFIFCFDASVCICLCWGRGWVKEVEPGGLLLFMTADGKCECIHLACTFLIVQNTHDAYKVFLTESKSSISCHIQPSRFLIDHWLTGPCCCWTDYLWAPRLSGSNEISSQLLAVPVSFHIFPFCVVLIPGPARDIGLWKEAACVLISSPDEWSWSP